MKVALVLLVASVLVSRSAGNPVGGTRDAKGFNQSFNGGVGTVNNCQESGSCHGGQGNQKPPPAVVQGSKAQNFNGAVDQVHNCAATGSCHGKKKRSIVPQA